MEMVDTKHKTNMIIIQLGGVLTLVALMKGKNETIDKEKNLSILLVL